MVDNVVEKDLQLALLRLRIATGLEQNPEMLPVSVASLALHSDELLPICEVYL